MAAIIDSIRWRCQALWLGITLRPIRGGAPEGEGDGEGDGDAAGATEDKPKDDGAAGSKDDGDDDVGKPEDGKPDPAGKTAEEYRAELRKYERSAKKDSARKDKEIERLKSDLKKREDADKSEHEREVEAAREEGRTSARTEAEKTRRQDQLEVHATRMAAKGIQIGEGDDAKTVRFADPEDALVHLERAVSKGDVDAEEIFDAEGRVKDSRLSDALVELLEQKPHLREASQEERKPQAPAGGADGGKGGDGKKPLEELSTEEHYNRIKRHKD